MNKNHKLIISSLIIGVFLSGLSFLVVERSTSSAECYHSPLGATDLRFPDEVTIEREVRGFPVKYYSKLKSSDPACKYDAGGVNPSLDPYDKLSILDFAKVVAVWSVFSVVLLFPLSKIRKNKK